MTSDDLRKLRQTLRLNLPTDRPVKFVRKEITDGAMGYCRLVVPKKEGAEPYLVIEIDKRLPPVAEWLVTIHEYAHALQWRGEVQESQRLEDHDPEWGLAEARVFNEVGE